MKHYHSAQISEIDNGSMMSSKFQTMWILRILTFAFFAGWFCSGCAASPIWDVIPLSTPTLIPTIMIAAPQSTDTSVPQHATQTPFLPAPNTATPTPTATATVTASATPMVTITPTELPTQTSIPPTEDPNPAKHILSGLWGRDQALPLSCEARSAVDWARYFGVEIDEISFQDELPRSDNPTQGFVGNPSGETGYTPPNSYGVYPPPVAALLQTYGLNAQAQSGFTEQSLKGEIAADRPVITWVIGRVWPGYGYPYTAQNGETVTVAAYEHTVIIYGYTQLSIYVLDGGQAYAVSWDDFLDSWQVLGNLAVSMAADSTP